MMSAGGTKPIITLSEAQAFTRVETGDEEALLVGLIRTASALCEAFLDQAILERPFTEEIAASREWQRLKVAPVRSIDAVTLDGIPFAATAFATDVDSSGCGWVRIVEPMIAGSVVVEGSAGMALSQNGVPEPIRHGVMRLVAHLFSQRDGDRGEIPTAVTALWRPYRRMRLA